MKTVLDLIDEELVNAAIEPGMDRQAQIGALYRRDMMQIVTRAAREHDEQNAAGVVVACIAASGLALALFCKDHEGEALLKFVRQLSSQVDAQKQSLIDVDRIMQTHGNA